MSLPRTDVIDLVVKRKDGGVELSLIVEAGEWTLSEALEMLSDKLNGYAGYALDGEMLEQYPEFKGKPITIQVVSVDEIPPLAQSYIDRLRPVLEAEGLTLASRRLRSDDHPAPAAA